MHTPGESRKRVLRVLSMASFTWLRSMITIAVLVAVAVVATGQEKSVAGAPAKIKTLKVTILSTMLVGDAPGLGEWGFSGLVEADGHHVLVGEPSGHGAAEFARFEG